MSADEDDAEVEMPAVPSVWRLAWLLFMQPFTLRGMIQMWGMEGDESLWQLRRRLLEGDTHVRTYVGRLAVLLLILGPLTALGVRGLLSLVVPIDWEGAAVGVAPVAAVVASVAITMTLGVALGAMSSVLFGLVSNAAVGLASTVAIGVAFGVLVSFMRRGGYMRTLGVVLGLAVGAVLSFTADVMGGVMLGVAFVMSLFRVPALLTASAFTVIASSLSPSPERALAIARWLPHRHHDLIFFPLPRLVRLLTNIAIHHPELARLLIAEAAATLAQKTPAQLALHDLQARELERAAQVRTWSDVIELRSPFFPLSEDLADDDPLHTFIATARDLHAADIGGSQHHRQGLLDSAARRLDSFKATFIGARSPDARARRLYTVAQQWSTIVTAKREALTKEIAADPEIPAVYVVGSPLDPNKPAHVELFRTRRDLLGFIDHDLDDDRRGPLLLTAQRRMGKSSLLRMLPAYFGTRTTIVTCDFQQLSGSNFPHAPHRWIVQELANALTNQPDLQLPALADITDAWGTALHWLEAVDAELARVDHRALIAIDEVERVQDGADEGWSSLTFLDFIRAAGDALVRIRFLLVSAHLPSSPRLGPKWADRLISALDRRLGPLDPTDAEQLLRKPVSYFPDEVFDDTATRTILAQTGTHPFLIQAVGDEIVKRLRSDHRRTATPLDVERALDAAVKLAGSKLFIDLWRDFDADDQAMMRSLAQGQAIDIDTPTFRQLREQSFVTIDEAGTPVLVFPLFGRWIRDYQPAR
jgi:hypothetical protein